MKCTICKQGETQSGFTVVTLQRDQHTLVIKGVPAEICENCGEYYLSQEIANRLYQQAEESLHHDAEVSVCNLARKISSSERSKRLNLVPRAR